MPAGTIALLESPAEERLESWANSAGRAPALDVRKTQASLDGNGEIQEGVAAGRVELPHKRVEITGTDIEVDHGTLFQTVSTAWMADVTGAGVVVAESVAEDDAEYPFPFDLFTARTNAKCHRQQLDIAALSREWKNDGTLADVWMVGSRSGDAVDIQYHSTDTEDARDATIGLGFERTYQGSVARGVCYESGYVAIWRDMAASTFLQFVADELLPHAERWEPDEDQTDFEDFGG